MTGRGTGRSSAPGWRRGTDARRWPGRAPWHGQGSARHVLHDLWARAARSLIAIDRAALPGHLIESELFRQEAGAFPFPRPFRRVTAGSDMRGATPEMPAGPPAGPAARAWRGNLRDLCNPADRHVPGRDRTAATPGPCAGFANRSGIRARSCIKRCKGTGRTAGRSPIPRAPGTGSAAPGENPPLSCVPRSEIHPSGGFCRNLVAAAQWQGLHPARIGA